VPSYIEIKPFSLIGFAAVFTSDGSTDGDE